MTTVLAWLAVAAGCVAAALSGQTARSSPADRGRRRTRIGMVVSMSGPWLAVLVAVVGGALSGRWLVAAAAGLGGVVVAALVGLLLVPR